MKKLFGITLMAVAFWAGLTISNEGVDGLMGRLTPSFGAGAEVSETRASLPQRLGAVVDGEMKRRDQELSRRLDGL